MNEINSLHLGQALLDAAITAKKEYDRAYSEAQHYMDNNDCFHPPLTKKGKHDKRIFCNDCWNLYDQANYRAMILHSEWNGAWNVLDQIIGEQK